MRQVLLQLHTWGGLTIGLLVVLLGLSGSALVYRADFERWETLELRSVEPAGARLALDDIVTTALTAELSKTVARIVLTEDARSSVEVVLQDPGARNLKEARLLSVFVDPYRGNVLGTQSRDSGWIWWLQDFHYALFAGEPGLKINGVAAIVLVVLALSGPVLWWPGWKHRRFAFRVRRRPSAALWRDVHAVAGVAACVLLLILSVTALYYAFRSTATAVIALASGTSGVAPPAVDIATETSQPATLDALVVAARTAIPQARLDELRPARRPGSPASISFRMPGDVVIGRHRMFVDPMSARVLRVDRFESLPAGARALGSMQPLHFGTIGGRLTQALWFIAGLVPAALFGSGLWLWIRRRRVPAARSQPEPDPQSRPRAAAKA